MASVRLALRLSRGDNLAPERFADDWGSWGARNLSTGDNNYSSHKGKETGEKRLPAELKSLESRLKVASAPCSDSRRSKSSVAPSTASALVSSDSLGWVQCDSCDTWRRVSQSAIDAGLPDQWFCTMMGATCTTAKRPVKPLGWVQCDSCDTWRRIPQSSIANLPDKWFCKMNSWDPAAAVCNDKAVEKNHIQTENTRIPEALKPVSKKASGKAVGVIKQVRKRVAADDWEDGFSLKDEMNDLDEDEESRTLAKKLRDEGGVGSNNLHWVRRSGRANGESELSSRQLKEVLDKIKSNHEETRVFKLKDHLGADVSSCVMESVLKALLLNTKCEALYIQNFSEAMRDPQLKLLAKVLSKGHIWCLNIGETYHVSTKAWEQFSNALVCTNVTHMYASEHIISVELKTKFRDMIRNNREKHCRHNSMENLAVIERCTNMWWNPIQSKRIQAGIRDQKRTRAAAPSMGSATGPASSCTCSSARCSGDSPKCLCATGDPINRLCSVREDPAALPSLGCIGGSEEKGNCIAQPSPVLHDLDPCGSVSC